MSGQFYALHFFTTSITLAKATKTPCPNYEENSVVQPPPLHSSLWVPRLRVGCAKDRGSISARRNDVLLLTNVETRSGPHPLATERVSGNPSLWVNWLGHEADLSPSGGQIKNAWSYTSTPAYVFTVWCLMVHRDNFTSTTYTLYSMHHTTSSQDETIQHAVRSTVCCNATGRNCGMGRQPCPRFTHIADRTVWDICTHRVFTDSESGSWFNFNFLPVNNSHENTRFTT